MKVTETKIDKFLANNGTAFVIPVYQRDYEWKEAQCKELLQDIMRVGQSNDTHFIGSIVYIQDGVYSASGITQLTIIDGQQRLTTITLIYIALYHIAKQLNDPKLVDKIYETYLINKFEAEEEKLKLKPTDNNKKAFKHIMDAYCDDVFKGHSRIVENFNYFKSHINQDKFEIIQNGLSKLIFVDVSLDREKDDPQKIFESLNSTGLKLEQADLIRNYILMKLKQDEQKRIYETYWEKIENLAYDETLNVKKVSDFIRDYLTLKMGRIPNKDKVYFEFKQKYDSSLGDLEVVLKELKSLAQFYNKLINPSKEDDQDIRIQLQYMKRLEAHVTFPFIMKVYEDFANQRIKKEIFLSVLATVESFIFRRFIVGIPTNALNKIFMNLYGKIKPEYYLSSIQKSLLHGTNNQYFPRDHDVEKALKEKDVYNINSKNRLHLFERLEHFNNKERIAIEGNNEITVEHIFPQNPDEEWAKILDESERRFIKENLINTIGNLTLSGNNGALGNKSFLKKQAMNVEDKEQGYQFSRLWLNRELSIKSKWDKADIEERNLLMAKRFIQIWTYPNVQDEVDIIHEEVNIFDAEDPKFKKLEHVVFFDEKLDIATMSELYRQVFVTLMDLHPEALISSKISQKLGLCQTSDALRSPTKINSSYFIETNMDSKNKFELIKATLTLLGYKDELFIKYAEQVEI